MNQPIIIIPARMASTRLPGKPLADIHGKPMIVHVWERASASGFPVYVAAAEPEIIEAVEKAGGKAILTDPGHPSGTDRIYEALTLIDPGKHYDIVVNVQGDLPLLTPELINQAVALLADTKVDIATLIAPISDEAERHNPNVVKAVIAFSPGASHGKALYFTRATAPYGEGEHYHHIGLYAYRRSALERFVTLPPSPLEQREKLEQLRALENDMHIEAGIASAVPLGVDTPEDLAKVKNLLREE